MPQKKIKRRFTRLAAKLPVQIQTESGLLPGTLVDLSRSGVLLKVPGAALGVYRLAPLALVGQRVATVLGAEFSAQFNPDRLGSLLTRRLRPVRIGQRSPTSADVEVGCLLVPPLTDEEAGILGIALPVLGSDGQEGLERLQAEAPVVRGAAGTPAPPPPHPGPATNPALMVSVPPPAPANRVREAPSAPTAEPIPALRRVSTLVPPTAPAVLPKAEPAPGVALKPAERGSWRAYVHRGGGAAAEPIVARTEAVSAKGVEVRVVSFLGEALDGSQGVAATATRLGDVLGSEVALRLVDGATHLWTGPARIEMVEVGPLAPHPVSLWLAFGRPLRPAELRSFGLQ